MDHPTSAKRQKRRPIACERCHSQKIKCSGDLPCQGCQAAKKDDSCRYPVRDRNVTVPESYIERLENEVQELKARISSTPPVSNDQAVTHIHREQSAPGQVSDTDVPNPLLEIHDGLFSGQESSQPVFIGEAACTAFGDRLLQCVNRSYNAISCNTIPDHVTHPAFNRLLCKDFQLPNRIQANLLVRRAHSFIGNNYHLFEKKSFFEKFDRAYASDRQPDLLWMCHLFAILALGELYSNCKTTSDDRRVPGTAWFVQAVSLLQDLYEVASIEQVQILLLLSFYSNALGRVKSAHVYCGIALRLGIGLGLHRSQSGINTLGPVQRESRRRVWWTLYLFDRLISSKLGYPLAIRDEDIDVELPSMEGLTPAEQAEFSDPVHLCAHVSLAKITGSILRDVYCLPQRHKVSFVRRVHSALTDLRQWDEQLLPSLRLTVDDSPRNLYTLHMQYYLCIIQTTRPILLHIFRTRFQVDPNQINHQHQAFSPTTLALAGSCVEAARSTNHLLSKLFVEGNLAVFGYFDAHYLFSSTLILIISAVMDTSSAVSDAVQMAFSLLRAMASNGNVSANDYLSRLEHIRSTMSTVRAATEQWNHMSNGVVVSSSTTHFTEHEAGNTGKLPEGLTNDPLDWAMSATQFTDEGFNGEDPLGNPFIESFLAEKTFQWPGGPSPQEDVLRQFVHELGDEIVFGT